MPKCTVCTHPDFQAIDQALLAGNGTLAALSRQYGPSPSALHRHKKHLQEKIFEARRCLDHNLRQGYLFKLNQTLAEVETASAKAQAADNVDQVFKGARVKNRLIRDLSKMETPWDTNTVYRLMASTQWQSQDCLLPTEPEFLAAGHKILAEALFHPCPEPTPDLDAEDDDLDCVEPKSPALSSLSPEILAALHPDLLASLLDTFTPPPDSAAPPRRQREISAKSAPKTASRQRNNQQNHKDNLCKKNTRKISPVGRESTHRAAYAQAPPAVKPSCSPPVNFNSELPPETGNQKPETVLTEHESLFDRLRRKWATTAPASKYPCDSENFYAEYLKEKEAAGVPDTLPPNSCPDPTPATANQPPETENPRPETRNSELETPQSETPQPETPKTWEPINPITHPKEYFFALEHGYRIENAPKYIPDRRWEEDFGNPRKFKGIY